jgi:tRNA nucleotidyltransferase (CCA-adding enzyme)
MRQIVGDGEADALVPDRVWKETEAALRGPNPSLYFEALRACGALRVILPEVNALFGVPQPAKWHPEIDTGIHTMMVLEQAAELSDDLEVRFAALVHDLGKGTTRLAELPSHPGHEQRGRTLVKTMCARLPVPRACRDLGLMNAEYHTHCHRALELRDDTVVKLFEKTDAFRRPERFDQFLTACEADARGRTGFQSTEYPQANHLREAFAAAAAVDAGAIAGKSDQKKIPQAIREARVAAVTKVRRRG